MDVIAVRDISKKYRINSLNSSYKSSFKEEIGSFFSNPLKKFFSKPREEFWALKDINFIIKKGEVVSIVGSNGAGKSTLLKLLAGITKPTSGQIRIKGRLSSLLSLGLGFHPELSGRENIFLQGAVMGISSRLIRQELESIIDFAEVWKFIDTPVKFYSSGMYMRLGFSVATADCVNPEILILDEVLGVGDAQFHKKSLNRLKRLIKKKQITVIFVSHNEKDVKDLSDYCFYLNQGRLISKGVPDKIWREYSKSNQKTEK